VPLGKAGITPLSNLIKISKSCHNEIYLITGNEAYSHFKHDKNVFVYQVNFNGSSNKWLNILKFAYMQLKISYNILRIFRNVNLCYFFIGGDILLLPMVISKLFRKKSIIVFSGLAAKSVVNSNTIAMFLTIITNINCSLADRLVFYSPNVIREWNMEKYIRKSSIAHEHIVSMDKFRIIKEYRDREQSVGYIGRFSEEKGIINFISALPLVHKIRPDIQFFIIGEGSLKEKIVKTISKYSFKDKIKIIKWMPHDELPGYLNTLKLIVVPSFTEGLPNIVLESMACGTPVLANNVGSIPDIIKTMENGFIMEDNSPETIASSIIKVMDYEDIKTIYENARRYIEGEYSFEHTVKKHAKILEGI
jgi:glycosyltransferase involved in cell wall biosynthesis